MKSFDQKEHSHVICRNMDATERETYQVKYENLRKTERVFSLISRSVQNLEEGMREEVGLSRKSTEEGLKGGEVGERKGGARRRSRERV